MSEEQHVRSELLTQALTREIANHLGDGPFARLATFVVARVSERERLAFQAYLETHCTKWRIDLTLTPKVSATDLYIIDHQPAHQIADCMRRLEVIAQCVITLSDPETTTAAQSLADTIVRTMARIWRQHPGYDPAWDDDNASLLCESA